MNRSNHVRIKLAVFHLALVWAMLANDCLFIHKHRTAQGVVIHTHPYNLSTDPGDTRHHHTNDEIFLLDIVFHGPYLQPSFIAIGFALILITELFRLITSADPYIRDVNGLSDLRAPPSSSQ